MEINKLAKRVSMYVYQGDGDDDGGGNPWLVLVVVVPGPDFLLNDILLLNSNCWEQQNSAY